VFNLVVTYHNDAPEPVAGRPVPKEEVRQGFGHIAERPRRIIEHGEDWKLWVLCDREPTDRWIDGRVALLGDAAHPMLQYLAQGACMAMEDAVCLAHQMEACGGDLARALPTYAHQRFIRTGRVQLYSRLMGDYIYHPDGGKAALRNAALGAMAPADFYDRLEWLYGGTGLGNAMPDTAA
jgi:salicylate hydroxylase